MSCSAAATTWCTVPTCVAVAARARARRSPAPRMRSAGPRPSPRTRYRTSHRALAARTPASGADARGAPASRRSPVRPARAPARPPRAPRQRRAERLGHEAVAPRPPSGNEPASQAPQTTPPAAPEKPTRCSRSPQLAHAPSCGASPAASSSFSRNASAAARPLAGRAAGSPGLLVEQRELAAQQVEHARVRLGGLEQAPDRVARARRRVERARVAAQPRVRVDGLRAGHRQQLAAPFVQLDAAGGRTAPGARRSGCARAARPWRSRRPARARACTDAGCGRPRRSASSAAPPPPSSRSRHLRTESRLVSGPPRGEARASSRSAPPRRGSHERVSHPNSFARYTL